MGRAAGIRAEEALCAVGLADAALEAKRPPVRVSRHAPHQHAAIDRHAGRRLMDDSGAHHIPHPHAAVSIGRATTSAGAAGSPARVTMVTVALGRCFAQ